MLSSGSTFTAQQHRVSQMKRQKGTTMLSSGSPFTAQQHRVRVKGNDRMEPKGCHLAVHSLHNSTESESNKTTERNQNVVLWQSIHRTTAKS